MVYCEGKMPLNHEAIKLAAYYLWEERGRPIGDPEVDWFQAEETLTESPRPVVITAVAEVVGSVLGSVAGLAASVGSLVHPG